MRGEDARRPQLDALRAIAVTGVLVTHAWQPSPLPWLLAPLDAGHLGVQLFFVLSGFLITGILLRSRAVAGSDDAGWRSLIGRFYVRRALRIFPIYYAVVLVLIVVGFERTRELAPWLLTYTANLRIATDGAWIGDVGHFWTLAVEEQFYLLWPWLVLLLPSRWLVPAITALIASGPLSRAVLVAMDVEGARVGLFPRGTFTLAAWDSLGMGALAALLTATTSVDAVVGRFRRWGSVAAALAVVVLLVDTYVWPILAWTVLGDLPVAVILAWVVVSAYRGFGGLGGRVLSLRPLIAVGIVSYGVYIFHPFVSVVIDRVGRRLGLGLGPAGPLPFLVTFVLTIAIAAASWRVFEKPINDLKRRVPYGRVTPPVDGELDPLANEVRQTIP